MGNHSLTIVVPCYNPPLDWEQSLITNFKLFKETSGLKNIKLFLVNDGSSRNVTEKEFDHLQKNLSEVTTLSYKTNKGKGYALRRGIKLAESDYYLLTDIDFPYTNESMLAIKKVLFEKGNVVIGNRKNSYYEKVPFFRKLLSKSFRVLLKTVLRLPVEDTQCGLKGFDRNAKEIFLQTKTNRYLFDLEFLVCASKMAKIHAVNVELKDNIEFSSMGIGILVKEFFNFLRILVLRCK